MSKTKLDFSRKTSPVPPPAPAAGVKLQPVTADRMPRIPTLPTDQPLRSGGMYVSADTKKELVPLGWQDGDPIPPNFAELVHQAREEIAKDIKTSADPQAKKLVVPETIPIAQMPAAYQAQLRAALAEAKNPPPPSSTELPLGASPSVQDAIYAAEHPQHFEDTGVDIIDDRKEAKPADDHVDTGATDPLPHICQRCRYDNSIKFDVVPDEDDKAKFLVALLGRSRFRKTLSALDGHLQITFRSLTTAEYRLVMQQIGIDIRAERIPTEAVYYMKLMEYRLAVAIERLADERGTILADLPEVKDIPYDPPADGTPETVLIPLLQSIHDDVLVQETLHLVVGQHHRQFQRLVEALEVMTAEPGFWKGIESPL